MIEGLKSIVVGKELKLICENRANFHHEMADAKLQDAAPKEPDADGAIETVVFPMQWNNRSAVWHEAKAEFFAFMAEHIIESETYLLNEKDLENLGIIDEPGI